MPPSREGRSGNRTSQRCHAMAARSYQTQFAVVTYNYVTFAIIRLIRSLSGTCGQYPKSAPGQPMW